MQISELKKVIRLFENSALDELELESEGSRVLLKKGGVAPQPVIQPQLQPNPLPHMVAHSLPETTLPGVVPEEVAETTNYRVITSPMVGTFYRAPSPTTPPFVEVGDTIGKGDLLCIIEAMKLMNEIECETDGKIVRILSENGKPVEFGEPLFEIDPI